MNIKTDYLKLIYLALAAIMFAFDQTSKAWANSVLKFENSREVIPGLLNFIYAQNTGVAFSFLTDHGEAGRFGLSLVALAAATAVLFFGWHSAADRALLLAGLAFLLAGIAGNVSDRIRLGSVTDFIQFHHNDWYFAVFNIADAAICVGVGLLICDALLGNRERAEINSGKPK